MYCLRKKRNLGHNKSKKCLTRGCKDLVEIQPKEEEVTPPEK